MNANNSGVVLAIVAPCFNEQDVLKTSASKLISLLDDLAESGKCDKRSFVLFVDDGSSDDTWNIIQASVQAGQGYIRGLRLARNAGHQNALLAGLAYVTGKCDAAISIDADLQDDLSAIPRMIDDFKEGSEIVLGVKRTRDSDSVFKNVTAKIFYKSMRAMGVDLFENHADCRLMSSKVLHSLSLFPEKLVFLRGLQPLLHSKISTVSYDLNPRMAGESKYTLRKMFALAWNGVTSFSIVPLRIITWLGAVVSIASSLLALYALGVVFLGRALPGWASVTVPLYLLGGALMLSIGIVGEYVGKIYMEVKSRPRYLVDSVLTPD